MNFKSALFWLAALAFICLLVGLGIGCSTCKLPEERAATKGVVLECQPDRYGTAACLVSTKRGLKVVTLKKCEQ